MLTEKKIKIVILIVLSILEILSGDREYMKNSQIKNFELKGFYISFI